jgi:hypothetical protein
MREIVIIRIKPPKVGNDSRRKIRSCESRRKSRHPPTAIQGIDRNRPIMAFHLLPVP